MRPWNAPQPDETALADLHYGVVTHAELLALGIGAEAIKHRLRTRRLIPLHPGVYALGHRRLRPEGFWLAAVKGVGAGAALSHAHAAALWDLRPMPEGVIHVTTSNRNGNRRVAGVRVHRVRSLPARETTVHREVPVTTVARTLLDLARSLRPRQLEQAVGRADRQGLFDLADARETLAAHRTRAGSPAFRALLDRLFGAAPARTRSDLEIRFLELCDAHDLPRPHANAIVDGEEVDFHWPGTNVIVEADSWEFHRLPAERERDHAKRLKLTVAGYRVVGITHDQMQQTPEATVHALRNLLLTGVGRRRVA